MKPVLAGLGLFLAICGGGPALAEDTAKALFSANRLACGAVKSIKELVENDEQIKAREMAVTVEHPVLGAIHAMGLPMKFSKTPGDVAMLPAPRIGQDSATVLARLGYKENDIAILRDKGIII